MSAAGGGGHDDLGVSVRRDLSASGRLARGGSSRMSSLHFHSPGRAAPEADEGSVENAAESPPPAPAMERIDAAPPAPAPEASRPGVARRLLRWLGLG